MVEKVNNLQDRLDLVDQKEKEVAASIVQSAKVSTERDTMKAENDKLRVLVRKKMAELKEITAKHETELKALNESNAAAMSKQ